MRNKKPPFEITNEIVDSVAQIAELVGHLTVTNQITSNPTLRRSNRIRTIHGSLAIEQNTLSLEQVTAVLNGKHVLAPPKDIAEVKNAYEIYDRLEDLDPYSVDDLLTAHGIMMRGLVEESGMFRTRPVGVVDSEGHVLHFGTLPQYVPDLVMELLDWVKNSPVHMLVRSCVFHYEFEFIHPFSDGNGRMGRLWQSLILGRLHPLFEYLPVENMVYANQEAYYNAIQHSTATADSGPFIEFMLQEILNTLKRHQGSLISQHNVMEVRDKIRDKFGISSEQIIEQIQRNPAVTLDEIAAALSVTRRSIEKKIKELRDAGYIRREGSNKSGRWIVNDEV